MDRAQRAVTRPAWGAMAKKFGGELRPRREDVTEQRAQVMTSLSYGRLTREEQGRLNSMLRAIKPVEAATGRASDKAESMTTPFRAAAFFVLFVVQATEKISAKAYLTYLKAKYECDSIEESTFPELPRDLFVY